MVFGILSTLAQCCLQTFLLSVAQKELSCNLMINSYGGQQAVSGFRSDQGHESNTNK
jgi:hypothetical protein